jgi:hypothetical protein
VCWHSFMFWTQGQLYVSIELLHNFGVSHLQSGALIVGKYPLKSFSCSSILSKLVSPVS